MSPDNPDNLRDIVDDAADALRAMEIPAGPPDQVTAGTLSALAERQATLDSKKRSLLSMRNLMKFAAAAVLLAALGAALWLIQPWGGQLAFGDVLDKVQKIKSVRFKSVSRVNVPGVPEQVIDSTITIVGDRMRQEIDQSKSKMVSVLDLATGEMLGIDHVNKKVVRMRMQNLPKAKQISFLEQLHSMQAQDGKAIGRKELGGQTVEGFFVEKGGIQFTLWVGAKSRLPVEVEMNIELPTMPKNRMIMREFAWDVQVDPAQMALTAPEGYDVQTMNFDASPPTEKDLLHSLRTMATLNGNKFPQSYDMNGLMEMMKNLENTKLKDPAKQKEFEKQMMNDMMAISRGLMFVTPEHGEDFSYAGAGVELNQRSRPIFWYKPKDSAKYHVIYADLTTQEAAADELPKIEAKKLTTQPATRPAQ